MHCDGKEPFDQGLGGKFQLLPPRSERCGTEPEDPGCPLLAADPPMHAFQHVADVLPLHQVPQFTDVPRPRLLLEPLHGLSGDRADRFPHLPVELLVGKVPDLVEERRRAAPYFDPARSPARKRSPAGRGAPAPRYHKSWTCCALPQRIKKRSSPFPAPFFRQSRDCGQLFDTLFGRPGHRDGGSPGLPGKDRILQGFCNRSS